MTVFKKLKFKISKMGICWCY